jgi:nuclear pore complex protein Nup85
MFFSQMVVCTIEMLIYQAMTGCQELDIWLAAHLGDVFDKLALIPDDEER